MKPLSDSDSSFANLEVFQYAEVDGVPMIIFCCGWRELNDELLAAYGKVDYTYSVPCSKNLEGLDFRGAKPFMPGELYAGRVIQKPSGEWFFIGFVNFRDGKFVGELSDPIPVTATFEEGLIPRL